MINLLNSQGNQLVNPYFLVLLRTQEVTPAYLYPSQDVWAFNGIAGASPVLGLQTGPLNGQAAFGDNAKFDWYLGGGRNAEHYRFVNAPFAEISPSANTIELCLWCLRIQIIRSCNQKTGHNHVILNGAPLSEESRQLKREILRCAQNDK